MIKIEEITEKSKLADQYPHYYKDVSNISHIDVYDVLKLFEVTDPCLQHAIKKLLALGGRGHKDHDKDFKDVIDSLNRYEIMRSEYAKLELDKFRGKNES